jgi:hypothetical protein
VSETGGFGPGAYPAPGPAAGYGRHAGAGPTQAFTTPTTATATPTTAAAAATTAVATAAEPKKRDLTVSKLVAGAGAAASSAVLGSFFGAMGTVGGAAVGSVFSAIVTSVMQHSLDKTRDTVKARVKLPGGGTVKVEKTTEVPGPTGQSSTRVFVTPGDAPTEVLSAVPAVDAGPPKSRRRVLIMAGFAVVVFAIGMLAVTGIELVKGSPLNTSSSSSTSGRSGGTSLGTVLGGSGSTETSTEAPTEETEAPSSETTSERDASDEEGADSSAEPRTGFGFDEEDSSSEESAEVTPTRAPSSGTGDQSDQGDQTDSGAVEQQGGGAAQPDQQQ